MTLAGVTTTYLVDTQNPTGYAQVVQESFSGATGSNYELTHTYVYGLERISERRYFVQNNQGVYSNAYYVYDGHGSVRALTNATGAVTDTYDYDAFGNVIHSSGTTPNNYLFAAEQFDPDLNLYSNRARYLNVSTGRFWSVDTYQGDAESPLSLHKYLYAGSNPVDRLDPSGNFGLDEAMVAIAISIVVFTMSSCTAPGPSFVTVEKVAYERRENGLYIALGARTKSPRIPQFPEYNWVQWVTTNAIRPRERAYLQSNEPYLDPPRPAGVPPFFYVGNEPRPSFGNYDLCFDDTPTRDPSTYSNLHEPIHWDAELFLVGVNPAGSSSYTKIWRITYGFTIDQAGNMTWKDINIGRLIP